MTQFILTRYSIAASLLFCALIGSSVSYGHQYTEQFIPIGQSPGISNKLSYIGNIIEIDRAANTLVIKSNRGTKTIRVISSTRFWIDRSKIKQPSLAASYNDCTMGSRVEVKYDRKDKSIADWIKIEST